MCGETFLRGVVLRWASSWGLKAWPWVDAAALWSVHEARGMNTAVPLTLKPPVFSQTPEPIAHRTRSQTIPSSPGLGEAIAQCTRSKINMVMLAIVAQAARGAMPLIKEQTF